MKHPEQSKRNAELLAAGEVFHAYDGPRVAVEVAHRGGGLPDFYQRIGANIRRDQGVRSWDRAAGVTAGVRDFRDYSISRLIRTQMSLHAAYAATRLDPFDRNADEERKDIARSRGASCPEMEIAASVPVGARMGGGTPIPWGALTRDFNVGTASEAGNLVGSGSKDLSLSPDAARNALALARLGAMMPGGMRASFAVPTLSADQTNVAYVAEVGAATEGNPTSGLVTFTPKRVTAYLEVSRQALIQGGDALDSVLTRALFGKAYAVIEEAAINGDGTGDNPTGVRSTAGISAVVGGTNGAQLSWSHLLDLEYGPASNNAPEAASGYLLNAKSRKWLKGAARGTGLPFMWDSGERPVNGHPAAVSNIMPGTLEKGSSGAVCSSVVYSSDWSLLLVPVFGTPAVTVDPYTKADTGLVRVVLSVFMSSGVLMPAAFAKMDDALTA